MSNRKSRSHSKTARELKAIEQHRKAQLFWSICVAIAVAVVAFQQTNRSHTSVALARDPALSLLPNSTLTR
ncbi:MAG: hypothetical protein ACXWPM_07475 [Bdellovibrionota bacterium]